MRAASTRFNPNPTLFRSGSGDEPYSRGQWDTALRATPQSPGVMIRVIDACEQPARSGAHGFRSHRPRSLLTLRKFCRIRVNSQKQSLHGGEEKNQYHRQIHLETGTPTTLEGLIVEAIPNHLC